MYEIRDDAEAAEIWYRKAAEAGDPKARPSLGAICLVRGDLTEARTWWRKAAAAGDSGAANNLELFKGLLVTKKRNSKKS
jgi:TPR repeat protein